MEEHVWVDAGRADHYRTIAGGGTSSRNMEGYS